MTHKCSVCLKEFKQNYLLQRHYNRKTKCKEPVVEMKKTNDLLEKKINELDIELKETKIQVDKIQNKINSKTTICNKEHSYKCKYCFKTFSFQNSLSRHLNRGFCSEKNDNISIYQRELQITPTKNENLTCRYCSFIFTTPQAYSRHINKSCNEKKRYESDLKERVLENRRAAAANITNNNTNINIIMPQMKAFGNENLDYLTTKSLLKELEQYSNTNDIGKIVNKFTKLIHANPAHPENHNVLFKSLNSGYAQVYTNNGFEDQQATTVQDDIFQKVHMLLSTKGFDHCNNEFLDVVDEIDSNYGELMEEVKEGKSTRPLSKCRNAIKAALHTHSNEIEQTHKLMINN